MEVVHHTYGVFLFETYNIIKRIVLSDTAGVLDLHMDVLLSIVLVRHLFSGALSKTLI